MADFNGIPPFSGPAGAMHRPRTDREAPAIPPVAASDSAGAHRRASGDDPGTAPRDVRAPAGPPPAFAANLLELERDLATLIARLEATRGHASQPPPGGSGRRRAYSAACAAGLFGCVVQLA